MLFIDAVKARLPLIAITSRDLMNFKDVAQYVIKKKIEQYNPDTTLKEGGVYYMVLNPKATLQNADKVYKKFVGGQASLVIVNSPAPIPEAFDAGELYAPIAMVRKMLVDAYGDSAEMVAFVDGLLPTLGGLTLKEVGEVIRLTEIREDGLTPQGVTRTRAVLVPDLQGFSAVMTGMDGPYLPNPELMAFAEANKGFFLDPDTDRRLVPRGALFDGESGTGKTQAAKWLADQWGVPLYRLDPSILNKYYGESENNLKTIFAKVEQEAPCILLQDEIEKLFGQNKNGGNDDMTSRLLGMMLWQMQEGRARVFYLMTSNRRNLLPPELIRAGRINKVLTFQGLEQEEGLAFAQTILASFIPEPDAFSQKRIKDVITALYTQAANDRVSHASLTEAVTETVKVIISKKHKEVQSK